MPLKIKSKLIGNGEVYQMQSKIYRGKVYFLLRLILFNYVILIRYGQGG